MACDVARHEPLNLPIYEVFIILKDVTMTWQKWGSKQALEKRKTSLSLMEVFNIAIKCSLQILRTFECIYCAELYNIFYSKRLFRQFHGLRCRKT
jgi:hypothetical protein